VTEAEWVGNSEQTRRSTAALQQTHSEVAPTTDAFIRLSECLRRGKFEAQNAKSANKPREAISLDMKLDVLS
jgi:hypothetical protein